MNAGEVRGEAGVMYSPLLVQESIFQGPVAPCALKHTRPSPSIAQNRNAYISESGINNDEQAIL
jgi:hypothetical protein